MKAVRVHAFGGVDAMIIEDVPRPDPGPHQVLVRVAAAGVGPWDCWVRAGRSVLPQPLPLTLGADFSGEVAAVGAAVGGFARGVPVYGATNPRFTGAYADYALAEAGMLATRPDRLTAVEAASVPVVGCTALQMLFDEADVRAGQTVVVLGGAGNVGGYAVRIAALAGARVLATGRAGDLESIARLGATPVADTAPVPPDVAGRADAVIDTVGGTALASAYAWLRPGGVLVSAVGEPDQVAATRHRVRAVLMLVAVTTTKLERLAALFGAGRLQPRIGAVLPLSDARRAHRLLEEGRAPRGKLVLIPSSASSRVPIQEGEAA